jgi:hypothetical protein
LIATNQTLDSNKCRSGTAVDSTIRRLCQNFLFYFGQMTVPIGLIAFCLLCGGFFSGMPWSSKSFKLPPFGSSIPRLDCAGC